MTKQEDFLKKVEAVLNMRIGNIVAGSVLKSNLSKLNKAVSSITNEDCKVLVENIVRSISLFVAKDESNSVKNDLEGLLKKLD